MQEKRADKANQKKRLGIQDDDDEKED